MKKTCILSLAVLLTLLCFPGLSKAQQTLTVYDGTETSDHVPAYIYYWDDYTRSQFLIPADSLTEMNGATISALTFYTTEGNVPYTSASTCDVYMAELPGNIEALHLFFYKSAATVVYSGPVEIVAAGDGGQMTITFTTPYTYNGGTLFIGIENTTDAGYKNIHFYGQNVEGVSGAGSDPNSLSNVPFTQQNFGPKTTFTYTTADEWNFGDTMAYCGVNAAVQQSGVFGMAFCDAAAVKYPASMMAGRNYLRSVFFYIPSFSEPSDFTIRICQEEVDGKPQTDASVFSNTYSTDQYSSGWAELPIPGCQLDDSKPLWIIVEIEKMRFVETDIHEDNAQLIHWTSTDKWEPVYDGTNSGYANYNHRMWPLYAVTSATEPVNFDCGEALDLPFTCGFEPSDNLDCWTFVDNDGDGIGWVEFEHHFTSDSYIDGALTPDNWMITPRLHIPAEGATLDWSDYAADDQDFAEHYSVLVSTTGTAPSDFTGNLFETTINQAQTWAQRSASLSDYAGQDIYIAFRHYDCTDQFYLAIDDISVTAGVVGISIDDDPAAFSLFPNPATSSVTVALTESARVTLVDLSGREVLSVQLPAGQHSIDLSGITAGTYFAHLTNAHGTALRKLVVR